MIQGFWWGLGGGGCPFWLHRETLTFMGPAAYQNTAIFQIGVNKIPPNFNMLSATSLEVIWPFKGLTARCLSKSFGVKRLIYCHQECIIHLYCQSRRPTIIFDMTSDGVDIEQTSQFVRFVEFH